MSEQIAESLTSGVVTGANELLPQELISKISTVADISKIALIVITIYFLIRIIALILKTKYERKNYNLLKKISTNLEIINRKLPRKNK